MPKQLSLRAKIFFLVGCLFLVTLASGSFSVWMIHRIGSVLPSAIDGNLGALGVARDLESSLALQSVFLHKILAGGQSSWLNDLEQQRRIFNESLKTARETLSARDLREALNDLESKNLRYSYIQDRLIKLQEEGKSEMASRENPELDRQFQAIWEQCEHFRRMSEERIGQVRTAARAQGEIFSIFALLSTTGALILGPALVYVLIKKVLDPIRELAIEINPKKEAARAVDEIKALSQRVHSLMEDVDQTQSQLQISREHLIQSGKLAMVGKLAAGVAHSIRNPLTSVKMRMFSLGRSLKLSSDQEEDFDVISDEIRHIDTILQNFLEFSRPPKLKMQKISPSDVVDSAIQLLRHRIESYGVAVELYRKRKLPEIEGDPEQLKEVLVNLIINACEAMTEGGTILIQEEEGFSEPMGRVEVIKISDNGPGISESVRDRVFQPFFSTKEEGTGLGLSIATRIIEVIRLSQPEIASWQGRHLHDYSSQQGGRGLAAILIVDDDPQLRQSFARLLGQEGYTVRTAHSGESGLTVVRAQKFDLVIMDVCLPGMSGLETFSSLRELEPRLPVIIMTAFGTTETAIEATKMGAFDYVLKPFDVPEVLVLIDQAIEAGRFMRSRVEMDGVPETGSAEVIIGRSKSMQEVYKAIGRVAPTDATVLIRGESGTGKELVARAIYQHSFRRDKPFLVINCVAIPEMLLESELFGYEKGAFTGAVSRRVGRIEQANGGTVFLDEIGDMPFSIQAKILRLLQEKSIERLGGREPIPVDVRIIAATNRDLEAALSEGRFRGDLYYRLKVVTLWLPPLRERPEDIPLLADYFLGRFSREMEVENPGIAALAKDMLTGYPWPGNVRELANSLQKALIFSRGCPIGPEDIAQAIGGEAPVRSGGNEAPNEAVRQWIRKTMALEGTQNLFDALMDQFASGLISEALSLTGGNRTRAAKLLGLSRPTLLSRIEKYRLKIETSVQSE